ncbi:MAG: helix-turn-helix transcriptional regulator [Deltaproteobacteria bacterium]|nr:helix-turn-helix transcriptional regulator [Deltaproteobacteria bacterium]
MDTIAERLRWILRHRALTQRELCRRAGMAETQLGVILRRLEGNPLGVELSTLSRLADGGKVDFHWLVTGIGSPSGHDDAHRHGAPLADRPDWRAPAQRGVGERPRCVDRSRGLGRRRGPSPDSRR